MIKGGGEGEGPPRAASRPLANQREGKVALTARLEAEDRWSLEGGGAARARVASHPRLSFRFPPFPCLFFNSRPLETRPRPLLGWGFPCGACAQEGLRPQLSPYFLPALGQACAVTPPSPGEVSSLHAVRQVLRACSALRRRSRRILFPSPPPVYGFLRGGGH